MTYYELDKNGNIMSSADFKFSDNCLETDKNIVRDFNGKLVFEEETKSVEYISLENEYKHNIEIQQKIEELKKELSKSKEDVEQVELFGMERLDYEQKKARCAEIILELRELEKQLAL